MDGNNRPLVWLIDENERELRTYAAHLELILPDTDVVPVMAKPNMEDYLEILGNPETVMIIVDQRLKSTGTVPYNGTDLASYLRSIDAKIPIYILTNYADEKDEFIGKEWSVEDIVSKDTFQDEERKKTLAARMMRRIAVYQDILDERERRFHELLVKSLESDLSPDEARDLDELQFQRSAATLVDELARVKAVEESLERYERAIKRLSKLQEDHQD